MLAAVKDKKAVIPGKELKDLTEAYEQYLSTRDYWLTDLSSSFHSPQIVDTSLTKNI